MTTPSRASCLFRCILKLPLILRNNIWERTHTSQTGSDVGSGGQLLALTCVCSSGRSSWMASCILVICLHTCLKQTDGIGAFTSYWEEGNKVPSVT